MNRIKKIFLIDSATLKKSSVLLLVFAMLEYFIWNKLNYYHKPNEISLGNSLVFLIFIASCVLFIVLIYKKNDRWVLPLMSHLIIIFFIDRITLEQGSKRYLDSIQDTWEFYYNRVNYIVKHDKELEYIAIYQKSLKGTGSELYDPILAEKCNTIENGWSIMIDSSEILIQNNKMIGFPTKFDTVVLNKIYF